MRILFALLALSVVEGLLAPSLGSPDFKPSPERPVGWRGDGSGRFPGATPPTSWSRRVRGITTALRYQAAKPSGERPDKDSRPLEYFAVKDWLVAGPFDGDPAGDVDFLNGEAAVLPAEGPKWKFLRADVDTQSRHDHNEGTCGQSYVDFVYVFGKISEGVKVDVQGDFTNKIAYAHTYIHSPAEAKVQLQLPFEGTSGKFWLNGVPTALDPKNRSKAVPATLAAGWNRLLVRIGAANGLGKHYSGRWLSAWMVAANITPVGPVDYETKNVAWMTKMTGRSMSQPIVVGDRLFVGANISDLMCLSKADGRVLWLRTTTPWDALKEAERGAVRGKIEPLLAELAARNEEAVAAINAAVSPKGLASDQAAELDKKLKAKRDAEIRIHKAFQEIDRRKYPPYQDNEVSSSNATPCSDGQRVYWTCGGGMKGPGAYAIQAFDLDGKRLWTLHETLGSDEHGNHQSPILVEGKLIFGALKTLLALDPKTGALIWKNDKMENLGSGTTPVPARVNGQTVLVTLKKIVRAADGVEVRASNLNIWGDPTPVVENGVAYNTSRHSWDDPPGVAAVDLSSGAAAWELSGKAIATPLRGPSYTIASPLLVDGILYGVDMTGGMIAVDVQSRKGLYRRWLDGYNRYNRYLYGVAASPALAGKHIFVVDDAGYTHLIQPGPKFKETARNVLENLHFSGQGGNPCRQESFYTSPWFEGKAMYLRGEEYLYPDRGAMIALLLLLGGETPLGSADFKGPFGFRGDGSGRFLAAAPPLEWSETKNLRWSAEVGAGYASPVLAGPLVIVASEPNVVTAVERAGGKVAWKAVVAAEGPAAEYKPKDTGLAAATPVTDGLRVYAVFANGLVRALKLDGTTAWTAYIDAPQNTAYGRSASPVLAEGRLIVHMTHLYAFDPESGKRLWVNEESRCAYGTPAVLKDVVVTPAGDVVRLSDGKTVNSQISNSAHASPVVVDGTIYYGEKDVRALRLGTDHKDQSLWSAELVGEVFGSPLLLDGLLFAVTDKGLMSAFEGGKTVIEARALFEDAGADHVYSSLTLAGKHLFLQANDGETIVLEATKEAKVVARNRLKEGSGSAPVFSGKDIFLRAGSKLVRVAE